MWQTHLEVRNDVEEVSHNELDAVGHSVDLRIPAGTGHLYRVNIHCHHCTDSRTHTFRFQDTEIAGHTHSDFRTQKYQGTHSLRFQDTKIAGHTHNYTHTHPHTHTHWGCADSPAQTAACSICPTQRVTRPD